MTRFRWDPEKAEANFRKHGIRFKIASKVFDDPHVFLRQDRVVEGELRWQAIGLVGGTAILLVAHSYSSEDAEEVIRISPPGKRIARSAKSMNRIVSINPADLELTANDIAELRHVAQLPDSAIDYFDIPSTTEEDWIGGLPGPLYRPIKKQVTLRIDADVLAWARRQGGRGYQSRLNAILREAMLRELKTKRKSA